MLRNYYRIIFNPENCVFVLYSSKSFEDMRLLAQKYFDFVLEEPTQEYIELYNNKTEALDNPLFLENSLGKIAFSNLLIYNTNVNLCPLSRREAFFRPFTSAKRGITGESEHGKERRMRAQE